jgi:trigger factor
MKKKLVFLATAACTIGLLAGCSSSKTTDYSKYVTLGDYKGLDLTMIKTEVTDDMVQDEIDYLLEDNATYTEITDRGAEEGDIVNIDYSGTIDGEEFDDSSAEDFDLELGSGYLLDDLEAALVGVQTGETTEVTVTFPDDYDEDLAGKEAVFTVTMNSISVEEIPEYTDDFIASVTDYSTTAEYEEALKSELYLSTEEDNRSVAGYDALSMVVENATFDGYPQDLYDSCKEDYDALNEAYAEMFGLELSDLELSDEETQSAVEDMVYEYMVCAVIADEEGLSVTDDEYEEYLEENYELYGYESAEEYEEDQTKESIMEEILTEKVQDFLVDNANVTEVTEDEYYEMYYGDDYDDEDYDDEDYDDEDYDDEDYDDEDSEDEDADVILDADEAETSDAE